MKNGSLNKNVEMHQIETGKFKDVILSFRFFNEHKVPDSWVRTLLAMMLADRCEKYPTKQEVSACLDGLYGASVSSRTTTYGKGQVLEFKVKTLNEKYVGGNLFERQVELAAQFLCAPLRKGKLLDAAVFEEALINLEASIQRRIDNPSSYAIAQCAKLLGGDQPFGLSVLPSKEEARKITLEQVSEAYEKMLREDRIDIFVEGQVDPDQAECYLKKYFRFEDRERSLDCCVMTEKKEPEEKEESRSIDQTTLVMMMPTQILPTDQDYWALRVGSCVYGQLPTSLLFQEVREKRSLCYSIYSSIQSFDGVMTVSTGIDAAHLEEVKQLIEQQRQRMADGDFDEEMLETARQMMINSILASQDDPQSLINLGYQNILLHQEQDTEKISRAIREVKKESIMNIFKQMTVKATFAVVQKEGAHEEDCE